MPNGKLSPTPGERSDAIARDIIDAEFQASVKGLCHPNLEWDKAVMLARALLKSPDAERLDWLERFCVEVRQPLVHGSHHLFNADPRQVEGLDDEPSNIRAQIDYQRNGGKKP